MKEKWYVAMKQGDFKKIGETFHIDPVVARILRNRNLITEEEIGIYLHGGLESMHHPREMKDMDLACEIIANKVKQGKKIRIIGDYDIDGVTAAYILYRGITTVGGTADTAIPHRITDGYGLNEGLIRNAITEEIDTIITCDNGIAASEAIRLGKKSGMTVIVTDHHNVPFEWREDGGKEYISCGADAVVNPKQEECRYPFEGLCGAGIAFKLVQVLYEIFRIPETELKKLLPYAALGTVGDVMELVDENRILVKCGLEILNKEPEPSMEALIQSSGLTPGDIKAYHIGFVLGPCINACGRIDTADRALELLKCRNREEALGCAEGLVELNEQRKKMTEKYLERAFAALYEENLDKDLVLVIYLPDCHESIAGIIAGRIRESLQKPVFILTKSLGMVKGSGRSIEAYSMYDEMVKVKDCFLKFGGHKLAAGLSMEISRINELRKRLNQNCRLTQEDLKPKVNIDVPMPMDYVSEELIRQFQLLEPLGKGNPKPLFAQRELRVISLELAGKERKIAKCTLESKSGKKSQGIFFGDPYEFQNYCRKQETIDVTYYPEMNEYKGWRNIQMVIQNYC